MAEGVAKSAQKTKPRAKKKTAPAKPGSKPPALTAGSKVTATKAGSKAPTVKASGKATAVKSASAAKKAPKRARPKSAKRTTSRKAAAPSFLGAAAGRTLVVVESPTKAKTLQKYLGKDFIIKASVGHVKDLPKSKISVDVHDNFRPHYEVIRGKGKVIKEIKDAAKGAIQVLLAPDPDREGEAIAWHLFEELGKEHAGHTHRITFNEITKRAVLEAIASPKPLNMDKFNSQQARRVLDRLVGYQISPILWDKVRRGLSAGRVQSVAVRLIVEREAAIKVFVPQEYWTIDCLMQAKMPPEFWAQLVKQMGKKWQANNAEAAGAAKAALQKSRFMVQGVQKKTRKRKAPPPLTTSRLQQMAANQLHFTAKRTMLVAQQLYEGVELGPEGQVALITYMRTDSTRVSNDALTAVREHIGQAYGKEYVPATANMYKSKKSAQDAHEAIRPNYMEYAPERVRPFVTAEQFKLYQVIWRTFVASQIEAALYAQTTVDISASPSRVGGRVTPEGSAIGATNGPATSGFGAVSGGSATDASNSQPASSTDTADTYLLRATGSRLQFPGYLAAWGKEAEPEPSTVAKDGEEEEGKANANLPELQENEPLNLRDLKSEQHFTQPPPRFNESSLVKELEERGIGRPSTYATILSTIVTRGYVEKVEGRFVPTELGSLITELLCAAFPQVLDVEFTAAMEQQLDDVEDGKADWVQLLSEFYYGGFEGALERAKTEMRSVKTEETPTEHTCETCGEPMVIKWGRNGSFLACKGYPKCRNTRDFKRLSDGKIEILPEPTTSEICPVCEGDMVVRTGRYGQFYACAKYPECKGTLPVSIGVTCPSACGGYVAERRSQRGRTFYGCSKYPNCTFVSWDRPVPQPCPLCQHLFLVRKYTKKDGAMIKCPNKECGYTRDPELEEPNAAVAT